VSYPAGFPEVISVGSVSYDDMPANNSNFNGDVELTAAGVAGDSPAGVIDALGRRSSGPAVHTPSTIELFNVHRSAHRCSC
jgi:hypothetical protein